MNLTEKLNKNQFQAATHTEGPLLILAGAGSGKTRVITHRIAYLINENKINPYNIFAVTFTNKAAEEMRNRVISLIGPDGKNVFIKTFHSASVYILRMFGDRIGIPGTFSIYDQSDQQTLIKEILLDMRLDPKKIKPSMLNSKITEIKNKHAISDKSNLEMYFPDNYPFNFSEIYSKYHLRMKNQNALDFDDLLIKTVELIREAPEVLSHLQRRWKYIMVDEYQDTNYAQYVIARDLASESRNICVVGDDDQSIYSWRGADIRNILNFEKDYLDTKVITLEENYRSTEQILEAATCVISNNMNRKSKNLISNKGDGEPPVWCEANNEYGEAEFVVNSITSHKLREGLKNSDFAIFYRTNAQSRIFEDYLRREELPYRIIGGLKFYDRKEIKDILAYLRFIVNPQDTISLYRIINTPARGIGKATVDKIKNASIINSISNWDVIKDEVLEGKIPKGISSFRKIIETARDMLADTPENIKLSKFVNEIVEISGYTKSLSDENSIEANSRIENLNELISSVIDFETHFPDATLDNFLQEISLYTSNENPDQDIEERNNCVTLMTVHNAKGLEFPVVFLTGMEENTFPHKFSIDSEEGLEEERRLCYVGITRAMDQLYITNAEIRRSYAGVEYREPSRFISEIPEELMDIKRFASESYERDSRRFNGFSTNNFNSGSRRKQVSKEESFKEPEGDSKYSIRDRVMHPKYGIGRIFAIEGSGDNLKLSILFGSTKKVFLEKYTPLEKLG